MSEPTRAVLRCLQKGKITRLLAAAIPLFATACTATTSAEYPTLAATRSTVRVMPLGDSITEGDKNYSSYRRALWQKLQADRYRVDFVGSKTRNFDGPNPTPDFDLDHEGHWGWRADEILANLDGWVTTYNPDVALIHLGSNDVFQNNSVSSTISELEQIIDVFRNRNPQTIILLAQIIPSAFDTADVASLNQQIATLAARKTTAESPVILVDQWTAFDPATDTYDGVHPNEAGELKMATRWYEALKPLFR